MAGEWSDELSCQVEATRRAGGGREPGQLGRAGAGGAAAGQAARVHALRGLPPGRGAVAETRSSH